jgi:pyrroloquinoline-quinone synthase
MPNTPWSTKEFEARLQEKERYYHSHHPFHIAMNSGQCSKQQVQGWVANRFYYQAIIPIKDSAIMTNCTDASVRRKWIQRIIDHDGQGTGEDGGIEAWLRLAEAVGLQREEVTSFRHVLPGVRFACDAYLNFARYASWQEAACSSLTELFAPSIHQKRLTGWPDHYPWIEAQGYEYFRKRVREARVDVRHGLQITLAHFQSRAQQEHALTILQFKLDILWAMLDAMQMAYVFEQPPFHNCQNRASAPR